jgi:AcrR family transcriptional regulator
MTRRAGLTRDLVLTTAESLADKVAPEPLTLNALAEKLDVQKPSLYNYFDGLHGLQRELALAGTRELNMRLMHASVGKSGDAAVFALAGEFRAFIHAHPGVYALMVRASRNRKPIDKELGRVEADVVQVVAAVLSAYRLSGDDLIHAIRGLRSFIHGFATLENAGGFGIALDLDTSFHRLIQMFVGGLRTVE